MSVLVWAFDSLGHFIIGTELCTSRPFGDDPLRFETHTQATLIMKGS